MASLPVLDASALAAHRARTFHQSAPLSGPEQALDWVNERGFAYFWPIKGVLLPSLWAAVAGERPVADAHDDPAHITWAWKDNALSRRQWYYAKVLRKKATLISLEIAPYFYALTENYGSPEEDHLIQYREGRLTLAARQIYEALLDGPLNTVDLRKAARMTSRQSDTEFNRALEALQSDFKILPVGVAQAGAWKYAFIYAISAYHYPGLPEQARGIGESQAREKLLECYFRSVGAAQLRDAARLFGWGPQLTQRTVKRLLDNETLINVEIPQQAGEWLALSTLIPTKVGCHPPD